MYRTESSKLWSGDVIQTMSPGCHVYNQQLYNRNKGVKPRGDV